MRKILLGVFITLFVLLVIKYCEDKRQEEITLKEHSALIEKEIKNVGKLVVTEGRFSEIYNYKNSKEILGDYFTSEKTALVVVNADVTVAYDLSKLEFEIDEEHKILTILRIPEEEVKIYPDIEYYDVQFGFFNPFEAKDYNSIKNIVNKSLKEKIEASEIKENAKNRLVSELSKLYILTNSLGWTLQYDNSPILKSDGLKNLKL
ncbi:DUF4230 domain-containing protein [Aestuariibaculum suncheonense]|uniref:DUF4230 domain-containing protein n=1 Tax=Aestuariibaculum suncheonense TaxID=1028745 RepID=A0A8J6QVZ2_9FLAO|nr:DUF4230 domain-containing protein [Aestuariibaculum suncheonense]MBD0836004.1 DUF4230 domain-containing protein [Aestuariibaculum suncheonense]